MTTKFKMRVGDCPSSGGDLAGCRLVNIDTLLVNLELVNLVLKRVEVDFGEPPLARCASRKRESGVWIR